MVELALQGGVVLVDDAALPLLGELATWRVASFGKDAQYAYRGRTGRKGIEYMHRLILDAQPGVEVDHRNGDGLDNRTVNLRLATHRQNLANQRPQRGRLSAYKGVSPRRKRWGAWIKVDGKSRGIGTFDTEEEAARAYDAAALLAWGEFARTNFGPSA